MTSNTEVIIYSCNVTGAGGDSRAKRGCEREIFIARS